MKREDFERNLDLLSFDEIEEDDFMLNTPTRENKDIFDMALDFIEEDNIVDTQAEQDLLTGVELDEMIDLAANFASSKSFAPQTFASMNFVAPSPSRAIFLAKLMQR